MQDPISSFQHYSVALDESTIVKDTKYKQYFVGYKFKSYNTRETSQISTIQRQYNWKTGCFSWFYIKNVTWFMKAFVNYNRWCYRNSWLKTWICVPFGKVCQKLVVRISSVSSIVIHEEALCAKSGGFAKVMKVVVKVKFILYHALNHQ